MCYGVNTLQLRQRRRDAAAKQGTGGDPSGFIWDGSENLRINGLVQDGSRENLQETIDFPSKYWVFL
jgi:hypothetical protein